VLKYPSFVEGMLKCSFFSIASRMISLVSAYSTTFVPEVLMHYQTTPIPVGDTSCSSDINGE
jgi:hypothetical protein